LPQQTTSKSNSIALFQQAPPFNDSVELQVLRAVGLFVTLHTKRRKV
jgi:hypothetical protein